MTREFTADEYIENRLDEQISWYDGKSLASQRSYKRLRLAEFVSAALIPFVAGYPELPATGVVVGLLGVGIAVMSATLGLYQFQERWIQYRTTCESLKKEKYLYLTTTGPYGGDPGARFALLVRRVEGLISKENTFWAEYMLSGNEKRPGEEPPRS